MTLLRKAAVRVSAFVERHASADSREWAEGLSREVEFIDGDWKALGWALGSTRVLLERRSAIVVAGKRRWPKMGDWLPWFWLCSMVFLFATQASSAKLWQVRIGFTVVSIGWALITGSTVMAWLRKQDGPPPSDTPAWAAYCRARLEEQLARSRTWKRWSPTLFFAAMSAGYLLAEPKWLNGWALFFAVLAGATLFQDTPAKLESRMVRIDEIARSAEARKLREATAGPAQFDYIKTQSFPNLFRERRQSRRRRLR
jgi:hypothetical protein